MLNKEPLILLLNKAEGVSSFKALKQVSRHCQFKKAGHTGTLDPLATGMLPICLGEATKFCQYLSDMDKTYEVTAQFGKLSSTGDREGSWIAEQAVSPISIVAIQSALESMTGDIEQVPPMYSAIKQNGQPLYKLARQGVSVERKARVVTIYKMQLLSWENNQLQLRVCCSKGTYIRTLVEDIAKQLNQLAYVETLHRVSVGPFQAGDMLAWDELQQLEAPQWQARCISVQDALSHLPIFPTSAELEKRMYFGLETWLTETHKSGIYRLITEDNRFIGLASVSSHDIKPIKLLAKIATTIV